MLALRGTKVVALTRSEADLRVLEAEVGSHCIMHRIMHRPARAISEGLQPIILVAVEELVAGLARNAEFSANIASSRSVTYVAGRSSDARLEHCGDLLLTARSARADFSTGAAWRKPPDA